MAGRRYEVNVKTINNFLNICLTYCIIYLIILIEIYNRNTTIGTGSGLIKNANAKTSRVLESIGMKIKLIRRVNKLPIFPYFWPNL